MPDAIVRAGAIFSRDARLALRQPLGLVTRWFGPVVTIAGFYFVARLVDPHRTLAIDGRRQGYFAYVSVNLSFMLLQVSALQAVAQAVRYDQLVGTLEPIVGTATSTASYVAGCALWPLLVSVAQVAFSLGCASLLMGLDLRATDATALVSFAVLGTLTMGAIGIASAAAVIAFKQVPPSGFLVGGAASLLAGSLFPTSSLPRSLQAVSWCLPLTHALHGLRGAVVGDSLATLASDAVWLAVAATVLFPLSLVVLALAVERARVDGTLAQY